MIEVSIVEKIVEMHIEDFRKKYFSKLLAQKDKPDGLINRKINNIFVTSMGKEISFYSALVRSLESSLGNLVERIGIDLSKKTYSFFGNVNGQISESQINAISSLLNKYHNHNKKPEIADNIERIVVSGGLLFVPIKGAPGNFTIDAKAADILFRSNVPITLIPIDVAMDLSIKPIYDALIDEHDTPSAKLVYDILKES